MKGLQESNYFLVLAFVILVVAATGVYCVRHNTQRNDMSWVDAKAGMPYMANIVSETQANTDFRKVLFTGTRSQLVVMSIPPGGDVGEETHTYTEQTLFFLSGTGKAILDGKESPIGAGDVVVVTPGTKHNFINTGAEPLKIYTVYAPPNHIDGRIHVTKADADKDVQDESYGNEPK